MGSLVGGALGLAGSLLGSRSASRAADTAANAQMQAGREAASLAAFRPVGITSRFGQSQFQMGTDQYGNPILTGAGYAASPEIQALQDRLAGLYGSSLGQAEQAAGAAAPLGQAAQGLFGLGAGYLSESPEAARQRIFDQLQAVRLPSQMQEEQRLASSVFGRGRAGLNVGSMGQPELYGLGMAREQQRAQDAIMAEQQAQQQIGFGTGLFGTGANLLGQQFGIQTSALSPFQTQFGTAQLLEQAAQQPLDIGAQLGGRSATAGANVGQSLLTGGLGAAQTQLQGSMVGPSLLASNVANFGQQYLQQQQQQNLFNQLYAPSGMSGISGMQWQAPAPIYDSSVRF